MVEMRLQCLLEGGDTRTVSDPLLQLIPDTVNTIMVSKKMFRLVGRVFTIRLNINKIKGITPFYSAQFIYTIVCINLHI